MLQAASLSLARGGVEALTTNQLARVAGVSVGSLYRYFPDKHAVVAELARSVERRGLELAASRVEALAGADGRAGTWELVGVLLDPALGTADTRRALLREVPRAWIQAATRETDAAVEELLASFIRSRREDFRAVDPARLAFVAFHAVEGVIEGALLTGSASLAAPWFREELFQLAWRYAAPDGALVESPTSAPTPPAPAPEGPTASILARLLEVPASRVDTEPRPPRSARGQRTADRVLAATSDLLAEGVYEALSVRKIAARAGLSVGALYRYFPSREAVVAELARGLKRRSRALLEERLGGARAAPFRDAIAALVRIYVTPDLGDPTLRRAVIGQVPRRWTEADTRETEARAVAGVAEAIRARAGQVRDADPERLAFFVSRAIESVAQATVMSHPAWIEDGLLLEECVDLAARYLRA